VNYRFNSIKATQVAAWFIEHEPGRSLNVMKLIKLVYLLDRLSISRRGVPVVGGVYYSMRNGPVTSELLDLINAGRLADESDRSWEEHISDRENHEVGVTDSPGVSHLSESEVKLLDEVVTEHGKRTQWDLVDWCHERCGEWSPVQDGRARITVEDIALNTGFSASTARNLGETASEANLLARALALG
jgi:uncharacterized phage-associated protein